MLPTPLLQLLKACLRELQLRKISVVACFAAVSLVVLFIGLNLPKTYTSNALLFANQDDIIKPLLGGKAAVTQVDHAKIASDKIRSRRILEPVARKAGLINE
ncbi:MAG: XrtA system polysaccharide chain length determinant, partial [Pseudomonadales bacterium]